MRPVRAACLGTATALAALLACAPVTSAATGAGSAQAKGRAPVLTLTAELAQRTPFPVNPGGPAAQGDRVVVRSILKDEGGNVVGESGGTCVLTRAAVEGDPGGAEECIVTYALPDGQITAQGMYFGTLNPGPPPSFDNAITGGTGRYAKARGTVHSDTTIVDGKVVRHLTFTFA
ncbi:MULTISPECIES: allene oxide cyclase barrel-like domain-containing protein [Streptomyces]|jgi:hypothetical protein|uniref:Allene oxide cyclase barrel-like domain-containing protein n=1 Tax=Streptomyces nymphaeiformis TaxID=2663842 RepID=A0A7W7XEZ5_9ACTN|nr:hypothetical protein [Streptomyces nymphaeiformis]MBB4984916.1 hypothetical protein [Streptomyces nymphaeiformis]